MFRKNPRNTAPSDHHRGYNVFQCGVVHHHVAIITTAHVIRVTLTTSNIATPSSAPPPPPPYNRSIVTDPSPPHLHPITSSANRGMSALSRKSRRHTFDTATVSRLITCYVIRTCNGDA